MRFGRRRRPKETDAAAPVVSARPDPSRGIPPDVASERADTSGSAPRDEFDALFEWLASDRYELRNDAIVRLGRMGDPRALPAIAQALGTSGRGCDSRKAAEAVRSLGASTEDISALLRSGTVEQRHGAAELFLHLRDPATVPHLALAIHDEEPTVRMHVAASIGRFGSPAGIAPLVAALSDDVAQVRGNAAEGLGILGSGAKAGPNIVEFSADAPRRSEAIEPLIGALDDPDREVRAVAAEALAWIGGDRALRAVAEAVSRSAAVRGGLGEPYCSQKCYDLGGQTIARHQIEGWSGDCSVCRARLWIGVTPDVPALIRGKGGSMVCYLPEQFLYFHQDESCVARVREKFVGATACVVCGNSVV